MTETLPSSRTPNPEQDLVVGHGAGPIRVVAGAGTGKTYTLTSRIVQLIARGDARPDQILALTFANKAAAEMRDRISKACLELGVPPDAPPVTVLTYHSFGGSVLSEWGGMVGLPPSPLLLSEAQQWLLLWDCLPHIDFQTIDLMHLRGNYGSPLPDILKLGGRLKDELSTPAALLDFLESGGVEDQQLRDKLLDHTRALLVYEAECRRGGVIDYGDQIALAVRALQVPEVRASYASRYRFVLVDEYQDTNFAQSVMVQLLVQDWPEQNVCVVGDVRQAIYRFRGAAPDNIQRFPDDFRGATHFSLRRNYRSTSQILALANSIWTGGTDESGDDLISAGDRQGLPVVACTCEDLDSEVEWIARQIRTEYECGVPYGQMAVLSRKNDLKGKLWRGLVDRGIPAVMTGGTDLYRTPEVREVMSYLRALAKPGDNVALAHIASTDSFGLDEAALYDLLGPLPRGRSLFDMLVERSSDPEAPSALRLFLATFSRLLTEAATLGPARIVERIIGLRRGAYSDTQRTNVYRFHSVAEDFVASNTRRPTLRSFVAYLNLLLAAPADEEEVTEAPDEDAVALLTVHGAKGLERDVVFVAGISQQDFTMSNRQDLLPRPLHHPPVGMPTADDFPDEKRFQKALKAWDTEQHHLEEQRITYVALTRAKDRLYLSWHRLPLSYKKDRQPLAILQHGLALTDQRRFDRADWQSEPSLQPEPDALDTLRRFASHQATVWAGWRASDFEEGEGALAERIGLAWNEYLTATGAQLPGDAMLHAVQTWAIQRRQVEGELNHCLTPASRPADADTRPLVDVPVTLSYSMLATYRECGRKAYLRFVAGFPGEPRPGATAAGTAFRAAVEEFAGKQQGGREPQFADIRAAYQEAAAQAHGSVDYTLTPEDETLLESFWDSPDRLAVPLRVEAEFYWRIGPGYLHGLIDRIQRCPDGAIELVDFKTSKQALTPQDARQNLQLLIYALAAQEVFGLTVDRLSLVYPRLARRITVSFSEQELRVARADLVQLMESARTATYDQINTQHCPLCEYRLICPAARVV